MSKRFMHVSVAILCLALAYHVGARSSKAQASQTERDQVGRFQLFAGTYQFVDGVTPQIDKEEGVFRIDTATGKVTKFSAGRLKNGTIYDRWDDTVRSLPADK